MSRFLAAVGGVFGSCRALRVVMATLATRSRRRSLTSLRCAVRRARASSTTLPPLPEALAITRRAHRVRSHETTPNFSTSRNSDELTSSASFVRAHFLRAHRPVLPNNAHLRRHGLTSPQPRCGSINTYRSPRARSLSGLRRSCDARDRLGTITRPSLFATPANDSLLGMPSGASLRLLAAGTRAPA